MPDVLGNYRNICCMVIVSISSKRWTTPWIKIKSYNKAVLMQLLTLEQERCISASLNNQGICKQESLESALAQPPIIYATQAVPDIYRKSGDARFLFD